MWQQDNAPAHSSRAARQALTNVVPQMLDWPPKSPDLSPIEQLWDYLKEKTAGVKFASEEELYRRLVLEWNNIPPQVIHNYYTSFLARCKVCYRHNGVSLNGHWAEVTKEHNVYRTKLESFVAPNGIWYINEVPVN